MSLPDETGSTYLIETMRLFEDEIRWPSRMHLRRPVTEGGHDARQR